MKRKLMAGVMTFCAMFCMTGCKEVVNTESVVVEATVVDKDHSPQWTQPIWTGKNNDCCCSSCNLGNYFSI